MAVYVRTGRRTGISVPWLAVPFLLPFWAIGALVWLVFWLLDGLVRIFVWLLRALASADRAGVEEVTRRDPLRQRKHRGEGARC